MSNENGGADCLVITIRGALVGLLAFRSVGGSLAMDSWLARISGEPPELRVAAVGSVVARAVKPQTQPHSL